jgi:hypothetical protein
VRTWALDAVAGGTLSIEEIRSGATATRVLRGSREHLSPLPDAGSRDHPLGYPVARFIAEVPLDQQNDLTAILGALGVLGEEPVVRRIA